MSIRPAYALLLLLCCPGLLAAQTRPPEPGEKVRVQMRLRADLDPSIRVRAEPQPRHEGVVLAADATSLWVEVNSSVVNASGIGIGHWKTEHRLAITDIERLEVERNHFRRPTGSRLALGLVAALASGYAVSRIEWQCQDGPCDPVGGRVASVAAGSFVALMITWPWTTGWQEVQLVPLPPDLGPGGAR